MGNKISSENQNELYILPLKSTNDKKREVVQQNNLALEYFFN